MAKIIKRKLRWKASRSAQTTGYKLYWARQGDLRQVLQRAKGISPEIAGDTRFAEFVGLVAATVELQQATAASAQAGEQPGLGE